MDKKNIKCCCKKLLARTDGIYIYLFCKSCKKEIAILLEPLSQVKK